MGKTTAKPRDLPLQCGIEGDQLVIRIGIDTLAFASEHCPIFYDESNPKRRDPPYIKVANKRQHAKDIVAELHAEREDGSGPLSDLFDAATLAAFEDGAEGFDEESLD